MAPPNENPNVNQAPPNQRVNEGPNALNEVNAPPNNAGPPSDNGAPPQLPQPTQVLPGAQPGLEPLTTVANNDVPVAVTNLGQVNGALITTAGAVPPISTTDTIVEQTSVPATPNTDPQLRAPGTFENTNVLTPT